MALMTTEASRIYLIARDGRRLWIWTGFLLLAIVALVGSLFLPGSTPFVFAWLRVAIMWVLVIGTIFVATQLAGALWGRGWLGFLLMVVPPFIGLVTGPVALEVATWRRLRSLGVRCGVFGVGAKVLEALADQARRSTGESSIVFPTREVRAFQMATAFNGQFSWACILIASLVGQVLVERGLAGYSDAWVTKVVLSVVLSGATLAALVLTTVYTSRLASAANRSWSTALVIPAGPWFFVTWFFGTAGWTSGATPADAPIGWSPAAFWAGLLLWGGASLAVLAMTRIGAWLSMRREGVSLNPAMVSANERARLREAAKRSLDALEQGRLAPETHR